VGSCSSPGELNLINKLRPVALNFGKDLVVSSKIIDGSSPAILDDEVLPPDGPASDSVRPALTGGISVVGVGCCLVRNLSFAILYVMNG
jgi:hypothetical protein